MNWLFNDKLDTFRLYYANLQNGWDGYIVVTVHLAINITTLSGLLYSTNATDDVFALGDTIQSCIINRTIPVSNQGARILINQDMSTKINFILVNNQWYCSIDRTQVSSLNAIMLDAVYVRA